MTGSLLPPPPPGPPAKDVEGLLRARLAAALERLAPSTRRAYRTAFAALDSWLPTWLPTAPGEVQRALAGSTESKDAVVRLMSTGPLVAGAVIDAFASAAPRRDAGRRGGTSDHLAPATTALRLAALRWAFRVAHDSGAIGYDLRVRGPRVRPHRDTAGPGVAAARDMLAVADAEEGLIGARDRVLLGLLLALGLRRSEVVSLDIGHFERPTRRLLILGKGHLDREAVTVPPGLAGRLSAYLALRGEPAGDAPLVASCDPAHRGTGRLTASGIYRRVVFLGAAANLARCVSPHRLRHTAITAALDALKGDVRRVRAFSRHVRVDTVLRYDDARHDEGGAVAAVVAGIVGLG